MQRPDHDDSPSDACAGRAWAIAYPVLGATDLIATTHTRALIDLLRIRLGFPVEFFVKAVMPVIERYAEFVQLLPARASARPARPGGRLCHGLELAVRALDRRRGQILPRGAAPEVIGERAHRWTYAVVVAALLHDASTTAAGVCVLLNVRGDGREAWDPGAGSMLSAGASTYEVHLAEDFPASGARDGALALRCFEEWVPGWVRAWLDEDAVLMAALRASLEARAGEPCGVFGDLIEGACTPRVETRAPHPLKAAATPGREAFPTIAEVARAPDERDDGEGVSGVGSAAEALLAPVLPSGDVVSTEKAGGRSLTSRLAAESRDERSAVAWRFMDWLKAGLAEGTIRVNEPRALVHGVDEGMLLVSPRIFRKFVEQALRDPGSAPGDPREAVKRVQSAVLRAGWHAQAPGGINLRAYQVVCGERAGSRLSGVVIRDAARFVDPAPSVDPALVRTPDA